MRRLATQILFSALLFMALSGCTKNNGDIGLWFGLWHLDSIEIDGEPDATYDGHYYFLFQGKVFCIRWVDELQHEYFESYAQWQEGDDGTTMTISFLDNRYMPQINSSVPKNYLSTVTTLTVDTITSKNLVMHYTSDNATTYTYHLTHWQ